MGKTSCIFFQVYDISPKSHKFLAFTAHLFLLKFDREKAKNEVLTLICLCKPPSMYGVYMACLRTINQSFSYRYIVAPNNKATGNLSPCPGDAVVICHSYALSTAVFLRVTKQSNDTGT
jgi:hypothetical protein